MMRCLLDMRLGCLMSIDESAMSILVVLLSSEDLVLWDYMFRSVVRSSNSMMSNRCWV